MMSVIPLHRPLFTPARIAAAIVTLALLSALGGAALATSGAGRATLACLASAR